MNILQLVLLEEWLQTKGGVDQMMRLASHHMCICMPMYV